MIDANTWSERVGCSDFGFEYFDNSLSYLWRGDFEADFNRPFILCWFQAYFYHITFRMVIRGPTSLYNGGEVTVSIRSPFGSELRLSAVEYSALIVFSMWSGICKKWLRNWSSFSSLSFKFLEITNLIFGLICVFLPNSDCVLTLRIISNGGVSVNVLEET
jgi:hypothetical protein